jgi:hypothetical protein
MHGAKPVKFAVIYIFDIIFVTYCLKSNIDSQGLPPVPPLEYSGSAPEDDGEAKEPLRKGNGILVVSL